MRIRIIVTQGGDRGRGQNQIADSLELQEKNFQSPFLLFRHSQSAETLGGQRLPLQSEIIAPCASRFRMRSAIAFENSPR